MSDSVLKQVCVGSVLCFHPNALLIGKPVLFVLSRAPLIGKTCGVCSDVPLGVCFNAPLTGKIVAFFLTSLSLAKPAVFVLTPLSSFHQQDM